MPRVPGMTVFPNSAPDSLTPKNLNFVRFEQLVPLLLGAVLVVVVVGLTVVVPTVVVGAWADG